MNNKISSIQIGMLLALVVSSMFLGLSDIIVLNLAYSDVLLSMIIGSILGIIPILLYLKINDTYTNKNIYQKNKLLFGNLLGNIINILLIIISLSFIIISIRSMVIFINSKYLQETPFFVIGLLSIITIYIISHKRIETIARLFQILFFATIGLIFFIEIFLVKYIEIDNILPIIIKGNISTIINTSIFYATTLSTQCILFLSISKDEISDKKNVNKNIIIFYLLSTISLIIVKFFVVSCFGYNMATMFRYPEYVLLKKIIVSSSDLHIENLLSFRWLFYMISLGCIATYSIKEGLSEYKINKKVKNLLLILLLLSALFLSKSLFNNIPDSITLFQDKFVLVIAIPTLLITIITFIRVLFVRKRT